MNIWQVLEIEATKDFNAIKQAYAKKIKIHKPEVDPEGFQLLRKAYEIAQQYAQGVNVNFEIDETGSIQENSVKESGPENRKFQGEQEVISPVDTAYYLLEILAKNEHKAIDVLQKFYEKKIFDNLEYSEKFQHILAINMLSMPIKYVFTCHIFRLFDWYEQANTNSQNAIYNIALNNLFIQISPYLFLQKIKYLSQIENKKNAIEEKLNWNECYAARVLLNPAKRWNFFLIRRFCKGKRNAILSLLKYIESNQPQTIGMGFSVSSVAWWSKFKMNQGAAGLTPPWLSLGATFLSLFYVITFYIFPWFNNLQRMQENNSIKSSHQQSTAGEQ